MKIKIALNGNAEGEVVAFTEEGEASLPINFGILYRSEAKWVALIFNTRRKPMPVPILKVYSNNGNPLLINLSPIGDISLQSPEGDDHGSVDLVLIGQSDSSGNGPIYLDYSV